MKISSFCDLEKSLDRLQQRQKFENFVFDQNFDFEEAIPSKNFPLSPENIFRIESSEKMGQSLCKLLWFREFLS